LRPPHSRAPDRMRVVNGLLASQEGALFFLPESDPTGDKAVLTQNGRPTWFRRCLFARASRPTCGWAFEVKFDGMRAQLRLDDGKLCLRSRPARDCTDAFPKLAPLSGGGSCAGRRPHEATRTSWPGHHEPCCGPPSDPARLTYDPGRDEHGGRRRGRRGAVVLRRLGARPAGDRAGPAWSSSGGAQSS
jgi:hypothetical protein